MIKRTIEVSQHPSHLSLTHDQLVVRRHTDDESAPVVGTVPCEDIGLVIIDHPQTTLTQQAIARLLEHGAAVLVCNAAHLPAGLLLPLGEHTELIWRINEQIGASKPLKKRLWQQIVVAKVEAQAAAIADHETGSRRLHVMAGEVKSGDTGNIEAQAAKTYWQAVRELEPKWSDFRRTPQAGDPINAMLNYGYTALRAAVARALVAAGLLPALGVHHANRSNAFCLADDLMEPLRPAVDTCVRRMINDGCDRIDRPVKQSLLQLLQERTTVNEQSGPLLVNLHRYVASLVKCFDGNATKLQIPSLDLAPAA